MQTTLTCLGGCSEVGRSSFLLDAAGEKVLLERGIKLLPKGIDYPLPVKTNLDATIISHAHLDHSGMLPHLFLKSEFLCYMTQPTLDIARMLWFDSLKIAGLESMQPQWTKEEIRRTEKYTFPVPYKRKVDITRNISMEFFDAGHIIGASITKLTLADGKRLLYTGDFRLDETRLFTGADIKTGKVDYLMIESTYGDRNHPPRKEIEKLFVEEVQDAIDKGGWAIIPAFAVGRSQEIVDILLEYKINAPIYYDGMAQRAARISLQYPQYLKDARFLRKALNKVIWVKNKSLRKKFFKQPAVVVSTAGMMQGGPILQYVQKIYNDSNSKILLTGYQVKETPGRLLFETKKISIDGIMYDAKAKVEKFDFSAHASQQEMLTAIKKWQPEKIILVHGDPEIMDIFKNKIKEETGIDAIIAIRGEKISLNGSK